MAEQGTDRRVAVLGIVGAGLMGGGIAQVAVQNGIDVVVYDAVGGAAERARTEIAKRLSLEVERGRATQEEADAAAARVTVAEALEDLSGVDAVIEAVIEDVAVKRDVFERLAQIVGPNTLLATNTSAIPITMVAGPNGFADRVIGMHFFSPVPAMPLCEIVRGLQTSDATVAAAQALAAALGKESILVNQDAAGFVTSRLMTVLIQEAVRIVESGLATPADVDKAAQLGFGHRMGPLATADLTGVDVAFRAGRSIYEATGDPAFRPPQLLERMVAAGRLGRKSGRGFFDYQADAK